MSGSSPFQSRWWIVFASFLGLMVSQGPISVYAFGVLLKPVSEDLGVSRGTFSLAFNLNNFMCAIFIPIFGSLIDRFGIRKVAMPMIALYAVTTAGLSFLQPSLDVLFGLFALQGIFSAGNVPTGYAKSLSGWFDRERGLVLGIAIAGTGLGVALMPPAVTYLIQNFGWRNAYIGLGAALIVLAFVPMALFIKEPPSSNVPSDTAGLSIGETLKSPQFWTMTAAFFLVVIAVTGTLSHMIAMLTDRGIPLQTATAALSMTGLAIIAARFVSGYCVDKIFAPYLAILFFSFPVIGIGLLLSGEAGSVPLLAAVLCGLGIGAEVDLMPFFVGRYFGLRAFGTIYGLMFGIFIAGVGLGAYLMGLCFDLVHSYAPMLVAFAGMLVIACLLLARLGAYRFPAAARAPSLAPATA